MNVRELIDRLERARFFGTLELKYMGGQIVLARKTESFKFAAAPRVTSVSEMEVAANEAQR